VIVEFDPAKDRRNIAKHGVSLVKAEEFNWTVAHVVQDARADYGERRYQALGPIGARLFMLVYTRTKDGIRAISLRPATPAERRRWRREKW
jgi:uncharacterized DUF497 family protein